MYHRDLLIITAKESLINNIYIFKIQFPSVGAKKHPDRTKGNIFQV